MRKLKQTLDPHKFGARRSSKKRTRARYRRGATRRRRK